MELIERILGLHLTNIYNSGKRLVEIKTLSVQLEAVKLVRVLALTFILCTFSFVLLVLGIFITAVREMNSYEQNGVFVLDYIAILGLALCLIGGGMTFFVLRQKTWLKLSHMDRYIKHASEITRPEPPTSSANIDMQMLAKFVSSIVEQKLKESAHQNTKETSVETEAELKKREVPAFH